MQKGHGNASSSILGLNLLGGFTLIRPGMECHGLSYEKGRALLAYLALAPGIPHARRSLASLLWPDHSLMERLLSAPPLTRAQLGLLCDGVVGEVAQTRALS